MNHLASVTRCLKIWLLHLPYMLLIPYVGPLYIGFYSSIHMTMVIYVVYHIHTKLIWRLTVCGACCY